MRTDCAGRICTAFSVKDGKAQSEMRTEMIEGKSEMKQKLFRLIAVAATLTFGIVLLTPSLLSQERSGRSNWTWNNSDDGKQIKVNVEGKVEFNDDYSDVSAIAEDGALRIYDSRGPRTFRLVVTRGVDSQLRRDYSVNGQVRSFDADGRAWLRDVLLQAVRQGGLDARNRVQRILKQRGARGLMEEIAYLKGDYVRRIYFEELLKAPGLTNQDLKSALGNASNSIASDYERAEMLLQVARVFLAGKELGPDYFAAVAKIGSAYEHARVLAGALKQDNLGKDSLAAFAQSAAKIDSDYEKASLLIKAAEWYQGDPRLRAEWLSAVRTIGSDYEHHRALSGALKPNEISIDALAELVESAARISSDYEKASFLIEAMNHYRADERLKTAFVQAAKTIDSEYERGRVQKRFDKADF